MREGTLTQTLVWIDQISEYGKVSVCWDCMYLRIIIEQGNVSISRVVFKFRNIVGKIHFGKKMELSLSISVLASNYRNRYRCRWQLEH